MNVPYGMQLLLKRILKRDYASSQWRKIHALRNSRAIKA
jgi:hypothetical protein